MGGGKRDGSRESMKRYGCVWGETLDVEDIRERGGLQEVRDRANSQMRGGIVS